MDICRAKNTIPAPGLEARRRAETLSKYWLSLPHQMLRTAATDLNAKRCGFRRQTKASHFGRLLFVRSLEQSLFRVASGSTAASRTGAGVGRGALLVMTTMLLGRRRSRSALIARAGLAGRLTGSA